MALVEIEHIRISYGAVVAVEDFSLSVDDGMIFALVGPDGAGKTSLFRSICGLIAIDNGHTTIAGFTVPGQFENVKPLLGYMPQSFSLYPDLSVEENLDFYAGLFGVARSRLQKKKQELYEFSGLGPFAARRAGNLSGGMKQKLALSCNLIHDPRILVLDEPTTGVDPLSRRQFWDILKALRSDGATIMVSTPYMDEVDLSDRAVFMSEGHKLAEGTPQELVSKYSGRLYAVDSTPDSDTMAAVNKIDGISARRFGSSIHIETSRDTDEVSLRQNLAAIGLENTDLRLISPDLEDVFIQLMQKDTVE